MLIQCRGHGTMLIEDEDSSQLAASVCGAVKRVNKLVMVQPFKGRCAVSTSDCIGVPWASKHVSCLCESRKLADRVQVYC